MSFQDSWRYCQKCEAMFYAGYPDQGVCAAGGAHSAQGFGFVLPWSNPATPTTQSSWRYCQKCHVMFFAGYAGQGVCKAGGSHLAQGYDFVLPHDVPAMPLAQSSWRYCQKCEAMFFAGYASQGVCPAGGAHSAQGFDFVLPHDLPEILIFNHGTGTGTVNSGSTECSFNLNLMIQPNGVCQFSGNYTNRGDTIGTAPNQSFGVAFIVLDLSNQGYSFGVGGNVPSAPQSGCNYTWNTTQTIASIRNNWASIAARNYGTGSCNTDASSVAILSEIISAVSSAASTLGVLAQDVESVMELAETVAG
jgi:hypothetical protein